MRVFLADDHPLLRMALRLSLAQEQDIEVVGEASDGYSAVAQIQTLTPDIALIDLEMPGLSGIRVIRILRKALPEIKILMLSTYYREDYIREAMQAGADGYVLKRVGTDELIRIIKGLGAGEEVISPYLVNLTLGYEPHQVPEEGDKLLHLTAREREVLKAIALGKSNKEISLALHVSLETVKSHIKNIYEKLSIRNRAEATKLVMKINRLD
jgi:DNA-binding NarL/FixJ family response regulator